MFKLCLEHVASEQGCRWYGYFPTVFETESVQRSSYLSISKFVYSTSNTIAVSKYSNRIFMISIFICILCDIADILSVFESEFEQIYENKYNIINVIRLYPVCIRSVCTPTQQRHTAKSDNAVMSLFAYIKTEERAQTNCDEIEKNRIQMICMCD